MLPPVFPAEFQQCIAAENTLKNCQALSLAVAPRPALLEDWT